MGAQEVHAVEIDPVILELGRELHPNHPYDHPRVIVHNTDARSFLNESDERFDLTFLPPDLCNPAAERLTLHRASGNETLPCGHPRYRSVAPDPAPAPPYPLGMKPLRI